MERLARWDGTGARPPSTACKKCKTGHKSPCVILLPGDRDSHKKRKQASIGCELKIVWLRFFSLGLITYFAANDLAVALVEHIAPFGNDEYKWKWAIEKHDSDIEYDNDMEEGQWHVHFVFDLGKSCTERRHIFDFGGFHPNIKPRGGRQQWKNTLKYLEKEGWFKTNIDDQMDEEDTNEKGEDIFREALLKNTETEFMETIAEGAP
jgi:hypothetical protein